MNEFKSIRSRVEGGLLNNHTSSLFDLIPIDIMYIIEDKTWLNSKINQISSIRSDIMVEIDRMWLLQFVI